MEGQTSVLDHLLTLAQTRGPESISDHAEIGIFKLQLPKETVPNVDDIIPITLFQHTEKPAGTCNAGAHHFQFLKVYSPHHIFGFMVKETGEEIVLKWKNNRYRVGLLLITESAGDWQNGGEFRAFLISEKEKLNTIDEVVSIILTSPVFYVLKK